MILACNQVYESCSDTDLFLLDTKQLKDLALRKRLEAKSSDDWYEVTDDEMEDIDETKPPALPVLVEKLATISVKG